MVWLHWGRCGSSRTWHIRCMAVFIFRPMQSVTLAPMFFKIRDDALARFKAIESPVRASFGGHAGLFANHSDLWQVMPLARKEQSVVGAHAMSARGGVHHGVVEHVADVQRTGDIGRRHGEGKYRPGHVRIGVNDFGLHSPFGPTMLKALWLVCLFKFPWELSF